MVHWPHSTRTTLLLDQRSKRKASPVTQTWVTFGSVNIHVQRSFSKKCRSWAVQPSYTNIDANLTGRSHLPRRIQGTFSTVVPLQQALQPMDTRAYPGCGLSLSQLTFALNEELGRVGYSPLFTLDAVSELDRGISTALATVREWRNSFAPINRMPLDILSLIPIHLSTQKDLFRASFVCRHWRNVFLQRGSLWSQLFLRKGEDYVTTLLGRAKGSALEIIADRDAPADIITLLSHSARQIKTLEFRANCLSDVIRFSELNSGQLPSLRTLVITSSLETYRVADVPSSVPFRGFVHVERLIFHSERFQCLSLFVFPNLTAFELSTSPTQETSTPYLLDFLKASPMLRTVELKVNANVVPRGVSKTEVVVLPNVENFSLHVNDDTIASDRPPLTHVYEIANHISCPRAKHISLNHEIARDNVDPDQEIFPSSSLWERIVHQYTTGTIEEVTLRIKCADSKRPECSLTFRSSDKTVLELGFNAFETGAIQSQDDIMSPEQIGWDAFSQACGTIRDLPLLYQVKRLHIEYRAALRDHDEVLGLAFQVRDLFCFLGPLDELTIHGCDPRIFSLASLERWDFFWVNSADKTVVFPKVKELMISHPVVENDERECMDAIVELAKSQYKQGKPFERVTVRAEVVPEVEKLRRWVDVADCREESYLGE